MKDIDQIRRDNMLIIEKEMGSTTIAANAIGMTPSLLCTEAIDVLPALSLPAAR